MRNISFLKLLAFAFCILAAWKANAFYSEYLDWCVPNARSQCAFANTPAAGTGSSCSVLYDGPARCETAMAPGYVCGGYEFKAAQSDTSWPSDYHPEFGCSATHVDGNSAAVSPHYEQRSCSSAAGSLVHIENGAVEERVAILGTPYSLVYLSNRVPGYSANRTMSFQFNTSEPDSNGITAGINIAGQAAAFDFPTGSSSASTFSWNGQNSVGAPVAATRMRMSLSEQPGTTGKIDWPGGLIGYDSRYIANYNQPMANKYDLGLWTVDVVHFYDVENNFIHPGTGFGYTPKFKFDVATSTYEVFSKDSEEIFIFNISGQHVQTRSKLTNALIRTISYSAGGKLLTVADSFGNSTVFGYDVSGKPATITSPYGKITALSVDTSGYLDSVAIATASHTMTYKPGTGLLQAFSKPSGEVSTLTYDSTGKLLSDVSSAGPSVTLAATLSLTENKILATSNLGRVREINLAPVSAELTSQTERAASGVLLSYNHNSPGNSVESDSFGNSTSVTESNDPRFGENSKILSSVYTNLVATSRNVSSYQTVTGALTHPFDYTSILYSKSLNSFPASTSLFTLATKTYNNVSSVGRQSSSKINSHEQVIESKFASFAPITTAYDSNGRESSRTQSARITSISYNSAGLISSVTNPSSQVTAYQYDGMERVTSITLPDLRVLQMSYDNAGNLTSVTPPSSSPHSFTNTTLGQVSTYASPMIGTLNSTTIYTYTNDREVSSITKPSGIVINFNYGASTGLLESESAGSEVKTYSYNANDDRMTTTASPDGVSTSYYYSGKIPTQTTYGGTASGQLNFTFNDFVKVASFQVGTGTTYTSVYDNDGLIKKIGSENINRSASSGLVTDTALGNAKETYTYDATYGERASYLAKYNTTNKFLEAYTRDSLGRILNRTVTIGAGTPEVWSYTYDLAGRLTAVQKNAITTGSYAYDANSNRTAATRNSVSIVATYDAQDRLLTHGSRTYSYNLDGERTQTIDSSTSLTTTNYTWDAWGQLKQVTLPSTVQIKYRYDAFNRRVTKMTGTTVSERYVYLDQLRVAAVLNSAGSTVMTFFYGERNTPEYMIKSGVTYKFFVDHVGSVRQVVKTSDGTVSQELTYDEFGRVLTDTAPGFQPFGFAGGLYDSSTKLVQFGARWYDAEVGRWISKDPILFQGGDTNLYGYVMMDPVNLTDPSGLHPFYDPNTTIVDRAKNIENWCKASPAACGLWLDYLRADPNRWYDEPKDPNQNLRPAPKNGGAWQCHNSDSIRENEIEVTVQV